MNLPTGVSGSQVPPLLHLLRVPELPAEVRRTVGGRDIRKRWLSRSAMVPRGTPGFPAPGAHQRTRTPGVRGPARDRRCGYPTLRGTGVAVCAAMTVPVTPPFLGPYPRDNAPSYARHRLPEGFTQPLLWGAAPHRSLATLRLVATRLRRRPGLVRVSKIH